MTGRFRPANLQLGIVPHRDTREPPAAAPVPFAAGGTGDTCGGGGMADELNRAVVRRVVEEIWNRGQLEVADEVFAPAYVNHDGLITDLVRGPEAIKISVALYRLAFPNLEITIDHLLADQGRVL